MELGFNCGVCSENSATNNILQDTVRIGENVASFLSYSLKVNFVQLFNYFKIQRDSYCKVFLEKLIQINHMNKKFTGFKLPGASVNEALLIKIKIFLYVTCRLVNSYWLLQKRGASETSVTTYASARHINAEDLNLNHVVYYGFFTETIWRATLVLPNWQQSKTLYWTTIFVTQNLIHS
jgi:hypothetical protein